MSNTNDKSDFVKVATFDFDWQAHIAKEVLEENDIPSFIGNEIFGSLYPIGFNSIGGITLWVRSSDADRAAEILANAKI